MNKKQYYQVSCKGGEFDFHVFTMDEYERVLDAVQTEMEDMEEPDDSVTVKIIELTDDEYQEILDSSE